MKNYIIKFGKFNKESGNGFSMHGSLDIYLDGKNIGYIEKDVDEDFISPTSYQRKQWVCEYEVTLYNEGVLRDEDLETSLGHAFIIENFEIHKCKAGCYRDARSALSAAKQWVRDTVKAATQPVTPIQDHKMGTAHKIKFGKFDNEYGMRKSLNIYIDGCKSGFIEVYRIRNTKNRIIPDKYTVCLWFRCGLKERVFCVSEHTSPHSALAAGKAWARDTLIADRS